MKIRERAEFGGGIGGSHFRVRVRELAAGEACPEQAVRVSDASLTHDWQPESIASAAWPTCKR